LCGGLCESGLDSHHPLLSAVKALAGLRSMIIRGSCSMNILNWDRKSALDMRPRPVLRLGLKLDVPATDEQKRCFEEAKKALLSTPYFCSWTDRQISEYLLVHLDKLACHFRFWYRSARITFSRKIWGCCSWNDDILINFNAALVPFRLREYLFVHELVHTRIKDHGKEFWQMLDFYTHGKAKALQKELHRYDMRLAL